jgi:hypothetical protein
MTGMHLKHCGTGSFSHVIGMCFVDLPYERAQS